MRHVLTPAAPLLAMLLLALASCSKPEIVEVESSRPPAAETDTAEEAESATTTDTSQVAASELPEVVYYMLSDA